MKNLLVAALIFCISSFLENRALSAEREGLLGLFKVGDCVDYSGDEKTGKYEFTIYKNSSKNCKYSYEYRDGRCDILASENCKEHTGDDVNWQYEEKVGNQITKVSVDYIEIKRRIFNKESVEIIPVSAIAKIKINPWNEVVNYACKNQATVRGARSFRNCK